MDKIHRDLIDKYCDEMVLSLRIHDIWPKLFELKIFKHDDINRTLWENNLDDPETVKNILQTIKTRGPYAFAKLIVILRNTHHSYLADKLEGKPNINNNSLPLSSGSNIDDTDKIENDEIAQFNLQHEDRPLKIRVRNATESSGHSNTSSVYRMRSNPRGLVLIITIIDYNTEPVRRAGEHDENNLRELFQQMGFATVCKRNLSGQEIRNEVEKFSQMQDFYRVDSSFVIISAHGTRIHEAKESAIIGTDGHLVLWSDIISCFSSERCPALKGKPKVFIFQSCRGDREQYVVTENHPNLIAEDDRQYYLSEPDLNLNDNNYRDVLIASSTVPGYVSYRDYITGSWYITTLCEIFMNNANDHHINDLFIMVDNRLEGLRSNDGFCQTTTVKYIRFNKDLYLRPGLY